MRAISERGLNILRGSHSAQVQAWVVESGGTGVDPVGTLLDVLDGDVEMDASADVRATLDITVRGTFPTSATDLLVPYGNEIFVRRGIGLGNGGVEWVSLGYYRINSVEQQDAPNGSIRLAGSDRMGGIVKARLVAPKQYAATATYGAVVTGLVQEVYPWATIEWDDGTDSNTLGRVLVADQERFSFLNDLVTGVGKIWFWDYRGVLVIKDAPDASETVWEVDSGENGVLVTLSRDISDEDVYNAVVASGDALDDKPPSSAVAYDNNAISPTYWNGAFGKVPRFYSSPFITTKAQAQSAANSLLKQTLGLPYNVQFGSIVNPALEPYDPVLVKVKGRTETHVLSRITVPLLVSQPMTADTREQTVVLIGES